MQGSCREEWGEQSSRKVGSKRSSHIKNIHVKLLKICKIVKFKMKHCKNTIEGQDPQVQEHCLLNSWFCTVSQLCKERQDDEIKCVVAVF